MAAVEASLVEAAGGIPEVSIAIVDGLPDLTHPALRDAAIDVARIMIPPGADAPDTHGTAVCSLIFGRNSVSGLAPNCSGLALPIFFGRGSETRVRPASQLDLARAIAMAIEGGASIINVSAGQKTATPEAETHLAQSIARCADERVLLVAAAGNDGCDCLHLPAGIDSVLAVGALGAAGTPLDASNWGSPYRRNGLLAPGEGLTAAALDGATTTVSGTSFATAIVSSVAALLLSVARREGYAVDAVDVRNILLESAAPCTLDGDGACDRYLAGTLDAAAALAALHRAGRSPHRYSVSRTGAAAPELRPSGHAISSADITGEFAMSTIAAEPGAARTATPEGISPSACSCQEADAHDDEHKTKVRPQALESVAQAPSLVPSGLSAGLNQQGCGCGGSKPPQIVYALGSLWFDFGTEARYDALVQQIGDPVRANNPAELFAFLRANPQFLAGLTFILMQDQIPLYAIQPAGPFALQIYNAMLDALESSLGDDGKEQRISLPGYIAGSTRLLNGMTVPIVYPDLRGMYMWRPRQLLEAAMVVENIPAPPADEAVLNFLNRVYYELRNLGVAPQERAINFAATNAYQAREAFADAAGRNLALDAIKVTKSPICRPDSDCWDVQLQMFDPENERRAGRVYRYTVDVSEVVPVTVGPVRTWASRLSAM